eukprot:gene9032-11064_t
MVSDLNSLEKYHHITNLVWLKFGIYHDLIIPPEDDGQIHRNVSEIIKINQGLKSVEFSGDTSDLNYLFSSVLDEVKNLPSLQSLTIDNNLNMKTELNCTSLYGMFGTTVNSCISRSLKTLFLRYIPLSTEFIANISRNVPTLESLSIVGNGVPTSMILEEFETNLNLRVLNIRVCYDSSNELSKIHLDRIYQFLNGNQHLQTLMLILDYNKYEIENGDLAPILSTSKKSPPPVKLSNNTLTKLTTNILDLILAYSSPLPTTTATNDNQNRIGLFNLKEINYSESQILSPKSVLNLFNLIPNQVKNFVLKSAIMMKLYPTFWYKFFTKVISSNRTLVKLKLRGCDIPTDLIVRFLESNHPTIQIPPTLSIGNQQYNTKETTPKLS